MSGELARDEGLSPEQEIMRVMESTLDWFQQEMVKRFTRLKELNAKFGSLQDTVHLMEVEHQGSTDVTAVKTVRILERYVTPVSMEQNSM